MFEYINMSTKGYMKRISNTPPSKRLVSTQFKQDWKLVSSIEGGIRHKTVFVAVFARKKTEYHYPL